MTKGSFPRDEWIHQQAQRLGNQSLPTRPVVLDDNCAESMDRKWRGFI